MQETPFIQVSSESTVKPLSQNGKLPNDGLNSVLNGTKDETILENSDITVKPLKRVDSKREKRISFRGKF